MCTWYGIFACYYESCPNTLWHATNRHGMQCQALTLRSTINPNVREGASAVLYRNVYHTQCHLASSDKYLVLSTCREEDETIRSNLYLRQIPDSEMKDFVAKHADQLKYVATRGQQ